MNALELVENFERTGTIVGRRVVLTDPESPRHRVVYEDIDDGEGSGERKALITLFPERAKAAACGNDTIGLVETTHAKAIRDMRIMIERHGYELLSNTRDIHETWPSSSTAS